MAPADVRTTRRAETRARILVAAWQLAERDGIASLSLRDLAREVGMRAPSLYTYFDSKAAIYDAMFAQGYQELMREQLELWEGDDTDALEVLTAGLDGFVSFCQASIPRYQLMFTRAVPDWQPSADAYALSVASYERMAARLAPLGVTGQDALDLWTAVSSGLAAQQLANDPGGRRWRRLARDAATMLLNHLQGRTRSTP